MGRRLMYLWDILHKNDSELVHKVFESQKRFAVKNDWVLQIKSDLEECKINLLLFVYLGICYRRRHTLSSHIRLKKPSPRYGFICSDVIKK